MDENEDRVLVRCTSQIPSIAADLLLVHDCLGQAEAAELVVLNANGLCRSHDVLVSQ
jgi:hypothetical protein